MEEQKNEETINGRKENSSNKLWREFIIKSIQEQPLRIEETAKYLTGLISIVLAILQINDNAFKVSLKSIMPLLSLISLLGALGISLFVLYPFTYYFNNDVVESFKVAHEKVIKKKLKILFVSKILFFLGISFGVFSYIDSKNKPEKKEEEKYIIIYKDSLLIKTSKPDNHQ